MRPVFSDDNFVDGYGVLECPECGGANLHHGDVHIYNREQEDGPGTLMIAEAKKTTIHHLKSEEFPISTRRGVIRILFACEVCHHKEKRLNFYLTITQCKGETSMQWKLIMD